MYDLLARIIQIIILWNVLTGEHLDQSIIFVEKFRR